MTFHSYSEMLLALSVKLREVRLEQRFVNLINSSPNWAQFSPPDSLQLMVGEILGWGVREVKRR